MKYFELNIEFKELEPWREIFIAELAEIGFESFVETNNGVLSYIQESNFSQEMIDKIIQHPEVLNHELKLIEEQNWNHEWEKNFDPVYIDNKLAIVAPFHNRPENFEQVIVIEPKMSFGTGHHQTTRLMSLALFDMDLKNQTILDMGTGTGVLAILAEKLGAKKITAIDIDEWSYQNTIENCQKNDCTIVETFHGGAELIAGNHFNIILANINKNVLIKQFSVYSSALNIEGKLLISGFFITDKDQLVNEAAKHGFNFVKSDQMDEWALLHFIKV